MQVRVEQLSIVKRLRRSYFPRAFAVAIANPLIHPPFAAGFLLLQSVHHGPVRFVGCLLVRRG